MYHVSTRNPFFGHLYNNGALNDRLSTAKEALDLARKCAGSGKLADVTPDGIEVIDGRTASTLLAQGCTLAAMDDRGEVRCYVWDEEAVAALDLANGD